MTPKITRKIVRSLDVMKAITSANANNLFNYEIDILSLDNKCQVFRKDAKQDYYELFQNEFGSLRLIFVCQSSYF